MSKKKRLYEKLANNQIKARKLLEKLDKKKPKLSTEETMGLSTSLKMTARQMERSATILNESIKQDLKSA